MGATVADVLPYKDFVKVVLVDIRGDFAKGKST